MNTFSLAPSTVHSKPASRPAERLSLDRGVLLLLLPVAVLMIFQNLQIAVDVDYWWHVRTGQYIVETRSLPTQDIFSYAVPGQPWVTHEWLGEVLMFLLQRSVGYGGEVLFFSLVCLLTWGLVYRTLRLRRVGPPLAATLVLVGFIVHAFSFGVRPQGLTVLLSALTLYLLTRSSLGKTRGLWLLPPLFLLWVNLHGGFIFGLALLGAWLAGSLIERALGVSHRPLLPLAAVTALSIAATLINPHGLVAWLYPFSYAGAGNASMKYIAEWQSPDFHDPVNLAFAASLILLAVVGISRRLVEALPEALVLAGLAFLALRSNRHIPLFMVAVLPLIGGRLADFTEDIHPVLRGYLTMGARLLPWLILVAQLGATAGRAWRGTAPIFQVQREPLADSRDMPVGAADYIQAHGLPGPLFNEYAWGGYLIYRFYPERIVGIDGRVDMYGDAYMQRFVDITSLRPGWRDMLIQQGIQAVLIESEHPLAVELRTDPGWVEVYRGQVESLFERQ